MKATDTNSANTTENHESIQKAPGGEHLKRLTKREKQVLFWIVEGKTNGEIGRILEISPRTVEKHCESIFRKLGIENRYAAIVIALTNKWTLDGESS